VRTGSGVRRDDERDRGVVIVWVALMIIILVGIGALVIDVGRLYAERRELQNGADAAALAVAQDCASGDCDLGAGIAKDYADLNAKDGMSAIQAGTPCGNGPGLPPCADGAPSELLGATEWVRVGTSTLTSGGTEVSFLLAPIISALTGKTVTAQAAAAWGSMGSGAVTPLVFSKCEWEQMGGELPEQLPTDPGTIIFHGLKPEKVPCEPAATGPSGLDLPGGFGRIKATDCKTEEDLAIGSVVQVDPGNDLARDCDVTSWRGATLVIAIYDDTNGESGINGTYTIAGFAGIKVSGYRIVVAGVPGASGVKTWGSCAVPPEKPSDSYICGEFVPVGSLNGNVGGPNFGARVIKMVE
jgi:hypothetical protein